MRVGIATVYTPGIYGGAEFLADGLVAAIRDAGHSIQQLRMPFEFQPLAATTEAMATWAGQDFRRFDGGHIDRMICLKFPAYLLGHDHKVAWLLHQHRPAYDLFGTQFGFSAADPEAVALRDSIVAADNHALKECRAVFTIAQRVSDRLMQFNAIASRPVYHPPADEFAFHCAAAPTPYIFVPSRLEALKRQDLFLRGLARCSAPVQAIIAGEGGQRAALEHLASELGIKQRVRFVGSVTRAEMIAFYAHAQAVFFGPLDEDLGYVTLEAMLSSKPVITCTDSGGPLEFVRDGETGYVVAPQPEAVADAIATLAANPQRAAEMGRAGRARYDAMGISWQNVVAALLGHVGTSS